MGGDQEGPNSVIIVLREETGPLHADNLQWSRPVELPGASAGAPCTALAASPPYVHRFSSHSITCGDSHVSLVPVNSHVLGWEMFSLPVSCLALGLLGNYCPWLEGVAACVYPPLPALGLGFLGPDSFSF